MTAHHSGAPFSVDLSLVNLEEMFGLEDLLAFIALVRSLLLELDNMIGGFHFMASEISSWLRLASNVESVSPVNSLLIHIQRGNREESEALCTMSKPNLLAIK